jgi:uncharacterized protein (TIGR02300 family)
MPELGRKYTCYSCHTKFYDLGKPEPICPKCGADQRDAEEAPATTSHRGRAAAATPRVVVEPIEDEFPAEAEGEAAPVAGGEADEEEELVTPEREGEPEEEEEDEEEEY